LLHRSSSVPQNILPLIIVKPKTALPNKVRYSYVGNNPVNYSDPSGYTRIGGGAGMGAESNVGRQSNPWAGPPTLFVDGLRIEAGSGDYSFWLGGRGLGSMNRDKLVGKVDYGGNLSSLGITSGMSVGPNGQLYSVLAANKISTGLANGTISYNSSIGAYGHTEYSSDAVVSAAKNWHHVSSSSNVINEEGYTIGESAYFVTDVGADGWGQGGGGAPGWMGDVNSGVGAFGLANGAKTELIDYAIRSNYKSAQTWGEFNKLRPTQQAWRTTNTLGKTGATYLKYAKGLGVVGAGVSTAYSITNAGMYYYNGGSDWQVGAKSTLDVIMTGAAFFGPIGLGISATYFILDASTGGFGGFGSTKP
jgi:hypothetical protein